MYSNNGTPVDLTKLRGLTHLNYAFGTISYSIASDAYYVDVTDPWADVGACLTSNCPASCVPLNTTCTGKDGKRHTSLVPATGATGTARTGSAGSCPASNSCYNPKGKCYASTSDMQLTWPGYACGTFAYIQRHIRTQAPNLRALYSIGGWYDSNLFSPAVTDKYRAKFVDSVVAFIQTFGFDGVDLDWEYPGYEHVGQPVYGTSDPGSADDLRDCSTTTCKYPRNNDGANFLQFLKDLKAKLAGKVNRLGEPYLVTMAGPGPSQLAKMPIGKVCAALDWVNVMTYDMAGAWQPVTNHNAPLYSRTSADLSVDSIISAYLKGGCPASKLVVGVPFYGRSFYGVPNNSPVSGLPGFQVAFDKTLTNQQSADNLMPTAKVVLAKGWPTYWDSVAQASYAYDATSKVWITYDSAQAVTAKVNYIKSKGLAGAMVWALGLDDGTVWSALTA